MGKIGFALKTGIFKDTEILALAYNKKAAASLGERLNEKLGEALQRKVSVASKTFHGFGLSVLTQYYGKGYEPKVLKEEGKEEGRLIKSVISTLINNDLGFQSALVDWFSLSPYENPQPVGSSDDLEECEKRYEECCRERINAKRDSRRKSYEATIPTFDASVYVRSLEERAIANWLMMRGVHFLYEHPDWNGAKRLNLGLTLSGKQKPYNPDFTYLFTEESPDGERKVRVVHEHFALDDQGNAPEWMGGKKYVQYAEYKRTMYQAWMKEKPGASERVVFFETRSSQMRDGTVWQHLENALVSAGIVVGEPQQAVHNMAVEAFRKSKELDKLIIDFVLRFKDSGLSKQDVLEKAQRSENPYPSTLFLTVAFKVFDAYQEALGERIDFSDMLRDAIDVLKADKVKTPYRFILVDEFQDISRLKADLVKVILEQEPDESVLFCVGDDWQTINRFSGSDIRIFTEVDQYFDRHVKKLELTRTFRCVQGVADVSRALVMKNSNQFDKEVKADRKSLLPHEVRVVFHGATAEERQRLLCAELERIIVLSESANMELPSVLLLLRTQHDTTAPEGLDKAYLKSIIQQFSNKVELSCMSIHGSKGLEADFVILPGLDSGFRGFPDERPPEPLLDLVQPKLINGLDEERRLFYVGLTRARYQAIILSNAENPSAFVLQLESLRKNFPVIEWIETDLKRVRCPKCEVGSLLPFPKKATSRRCSRRSMCGYYEKSPK